MKMNYKILSVVFILAVAIISCEEEETAYIDPMIKGISNNVAEASGKLTAGSWNGAIVGLRDQRIKLLNIKALIANGKYKDDGYDLKNSAATDKVVSETLQMVEFKIDSIWNANIKGSFDAINTNSAGIVNLGTTAYGLANTKLNEAYAWIMEENEGVSEVKLTINDFVNLQGSVAVLTGLAQLDEQSVIAYVDGIKLRFADMQQQYTDLANEVSTSPFFSKAQKQRYTLLEQPLADMEATISGQITLATQDELDLIDRDLVALVYFTQNNNTSPAQKPLIFGEISSITELRWLSETATAEEVSGTWVLTTDIDAAETHRWNEGAGFSAIPTFSGTFDGQSHIISSLKLGKTTTKSGFIGILPATGVIKNLGLYNANGKVVGVMGGLLVGQIIGGAIENCFVTGINGTGGQSGTLTGRCDGAKITNCFSAAAINHLAANNVGHIFGTATGIISLNSVYATGLIVKGPDNVGALSGNIVVVAVEDVTANGAYFDSSTIGITTGSNNKANQVVFNALFKDLPTSQWNDLASFPEFSPSVWEIKTITEIDVNARPYLKGFNYEGIKDFIVPQP